MIKMMARVLLYAAVNPFLFGLSPIRSSATLAGPADSSFLDTELPNMDSVAARIAEKLVKTKNTVVAVSDFHAEKSADSHGYGAKLSAQLSAALTKTNAGIQVFDNGRLARALEEKKWMAIDLHDPLVFRSTANAEGVHVAIDGRYKTAGQSIEVSLTLTNTADDKKVAEFKIKLPAPQKSESSPDTPVRDPITQVYLAIAGGVTSP